MTTPPISNSTPVEDSPTYILPNGKIVKNRQINSKYNIGNMSNKEFEKWAKQMGGKPY